MVFPAGFAPATRCFVNSRSRLLSYGNKNECGVLESHQAGRVGARVTTEVASLTIYRRMAGNEPNIVGASGMPSPPVEEMALVRDRPRDTAC